MKLLLTEHEFCSQQVSHSSGNETIGTLTGIVTYIKADDGYYVLSRYEDDQWVFPASKLVAGKTRADQILDYSKIIDQVHRRMAKWVILNKMIEGHSIGTLRHQFINLSVYYKWVNQSDIVTSQGLNAFTSREYVKYVNSLTSTQEKYKGKPLALLTKAHKFIAVENIYRHCKHFSFVKEHPWVGSSALEQAGAIGYVAENLRKNPKTELIPDEVLKPLCVFTKTYIDRANELLGYKEKLDLFVPTAKFSARRSIQRTNVLHSLGYDKSLSWFNEELTILRDSCIFWILLTTGMRIHEVLGIKRGLGVGYRTEIVKGETYYYVKSISSKTYAGESEWIAPKITIDAIKILERYTKKFQVILIENMRIAKEKKEFKEVDRLKKLSGSIWLTFDVCHFHKVSVISSQAITEYRLPNLCRLANVDWDLKAHQFRRTFANHAVHSELGDLRALREHFKHWTLSMVALYAANPGLDEEMMEELLHERYLVEQEICNDWFSLEKPITGGRAAKKSLEIRANDEKVKIYSSRQEMVKSFASSISFRATGLGWCISDDGICMNNCAECDNGVVDSRHIKHWESVFIQQLELLEVEDIGRTGQHAVQLVMKQCERVLTELGVDIDVIKRDFTKKYKEGYSDE